jgi:AraC-like DNA-binding protein
MEPLARVRIVMWEGGGLWIVDAARAAEPGVRRADFHAHHAIQVTLRLDGWFTLDTDDVHVGGAAAAVAADARHVIDAEGLFAILFVEPESRTGRALARRLFKDAELVPVPPEMLSDLPERIAGAYRSPVRDDEALIDLGRALAAGLGGDGIVAEPDARVRKVIAWAAAQLDEPIGLAEAVEVSTLSASRLRHLFVEQTGLPFKTYLLWLRLTRALEAYAEGAPLTQAAHDAGFADSAHLSRTFRRMFGVAPSVLRMV